MSIFKAALISTVSVNKDTSVNHTHSDAMTERYYPTLRHFCVFQHIVLALWPANVEDNRQLLF